MKSNKPVSIYDAIINKYSSFLRLLIACHFFFYDNYLLTIVRLSIIIVEELPGYSTEYTVE